MEDARKLLTQSVQSIRASPSSAESFSVNLVKDMQTILGNMQSTHQYHSVGAKMMSMNMQCHQVQRSSHSSQWASQGAYENSPKRAMKSKFRSHK